MFEISGKWLILLGLILISDGCGTASPTSPSTLTVTEQNAGSTIELRVGQTLQVVLQANPSTGYAWTVDTLNQAILRSVGEPQFTPDSSAIGAGGKMTLRFQAVAAGQTRLKLIYQRPWETTVFPLSVFEIAVAVK